MRYRSTRSYSHRHINDIIPLEQSFIIILSIILIFIIIKHIKHQAKTKRDDDFFNKSIKDGYCFIEASNEIPEIPYHFQLLRSAEQYPTYSSIIMGERNGMSFGIMDYTFIYHKGKHTYIELCTLWIMTCGHNSNIHSFILNYRNGFNELFNYSNTKITFPEDKAFSNCYSLSGPDEQSLKKLFNQDLRTAFVTANNYQFDFESSRGFFLVATKKIFRPDDYETRIRILDKMIDLYRILLARYK